jgi:hypothetical protein
MDPSTESPQPELFTDLVIAEAKQFTEFVLKSFPELEGVAVTLSWRPPLSNLPTAVIRGRNGALTTPGEVTHMQEQFLAGVRHLQNQLDTSLRAVDNLMAAKAAELKHLEQEIVRKHAALSRLPYAPDN